jgi:hypothetical protein
VKKAGLPTSDGLLGLAGDDQFTQRVAVVARFSGGDAEVVARTFGAPLPTAAADAGAGVTALPGDTAAAFSIAGGGESFRERWTALTKGLGASAEDVVEGARQQTGLDLPGDVAALFGRRLTMALALGPEGLSGMPRIGVRGASDDAALPAALERLLAFTDRSGVPLEKRDVAGGYVLATTREQAEAMVAGGDLGGSRNFRDAVPSTEDAVAVAYVDAQRLSDAAASGDWGDEEGRRALAALRSVGLTVTRTTDGAQMTFRVITR